jgi:proline dehydrogenase
MALLEKLLVPRSPVASRLFALAKRFVAGETVEEAIAAVRALNDAGMTATLDYLGEDVTTEAEAQATHDGYSALITALRTSGVRSNLSLKLTALGLGVSETLAVAHLRSIVEEARVLDDPFVRVDMEGSGLVDATLRSFERVYAELPSVGPVLQAYLKRTPKDVEAAIALGARVRLCKGAYREPPEIAYPEMPVIRREFLRLAEALLERGHYPGIATHDERLIRAVRGFTTERGIAADRFEFQLLYGVRPDLQRALVADGYRVRVYVPYGTHWAGYFYRRISERRENALFALRSLVSR